MHFDEYFAAQVDCMYSMHGTGVAVQLYSRVCAVVLCAVSHVEHIMADAGRATCAHDHRQPF